MFQLSLAITFAAAIALLAVWIVGVWYVNEWGIPAAKLSNYHNVLIIFPHPDDETNLSGTVRRLHNLGARVTLAILTKGECGTPDAHLDPALKVTRSQEMQRASTLLGANLIQQDFGDGQLARKMPSMRSYLRTLLQDIQPDLVITYDLAGLYGHEDHIACAKVVTDLLTASHPRTPLWYTAFPKRLLRTMHLPSHMAKDSTFAAKRARCTARVFVGNCLIVKIRGLYAHRSQLSSFRKSIPWPLPLWLAYSLRVYEYFDVIR